MAPMPFGASLDYYGLVDVSLSLLLHHNWHFLSRLYN